MKHGKNPDPQQRAGLDQNPGLPDMSTIDFSSAAPLRMTRYERREFHARGGLGEVWRSEDSVLGREVALKILRRNDEATRLRFEAEAQITGQLEHPNIVPVHDLGRDDEGQPYYVMKFVRGSTLKSVITEFYSPSAETGPGRQVRWMQLLQIFLDLCHAVAYAHSRGVIHRDLKPDNVMLGAYGETLLLDWGLAKLLDEPTVGGETESGSGWCKLRQFDSGSATGEGTVMGTPGYMAPEMAAGRTVKTDLRTDIYLLGATLYEIITGQIPRRGASRDEVVEMARTVPPPPARQIRSACPRALEAIAAKAMAHRPEDRYPSVMAMADDIQRYLAGESVSVCPESLPWRAWRWCKRHRTAIFRTATVLVLIGLISAAVMSERELSNARKRDQARRDVSEFRRLAALSMDSAANADLPGERTPYYDVGRGQEEIAKAMQIVDRWGASLDLCPLPDQLPQLRSEVYTLLLLGAQLNNRSPEQAKQALQMLKRAATVNPAESRGYHRILSQTLRLTDKPEEAGIEMKLADDPSSPPDANDLFLEGEALRWQTAAAPEPALRFALLHKAVSKYRDALDIDPSHYWAHFQLGRCQLALGHPDDAATELGTCIALHPEQPWGYSARGFALALARKYDEAHKDFDKASEIDSTFLPARMNEGVCYWLQARSQGMLQRNQYYQNARQALNAALKLPEEHGLPEAAYYLGRIDLEERDFDMAIEDCSRGLRDRELSELYGCRAIAYLLREDKDHREGHLTEAKNAHDCCLADLDACAGLGTSTSENERHKVRGHILAHWPEDWPARDDRLPILKLAREELSKASDSSAEVLTDRGLAAEDDSEAVAYFKKSLELDSANAKTWAFLGEAHDRLAHAPLDHRLSYVDFNSATQLAPLDALSHAWLGYECTWVGAREDALREAVMAMELAENDYRAIVTVACIHSRMSQLDSPGSIMSTQQLDSTVAALRCAVKAWHTTLGGPDLIPLIVDEESFLKNPQLLARDDFYALDPAIKPGIERHRAH
jgi:serine/threonine protein kinase/Flp pilus assembly protein TadD